MKLTRDNFQELLTPIHKKIIADEYGKLEPQYEKVFKVHDMKKKDESYPHIGAFGLWAENTEGNTINEDEINQGETARLEARRFDKGYSVTWELTRDDLYGVLDGRGKDGSARMLARGLRTTIETDAANVINNGFTQVGYDGVSLFSSSHPLADSSLLGDNLITGELTPENVKLGLTKVRNQVNEAGVKIQSRAKQIIVGPDNEYTSRDILRSTNQAFEMSNTINSIEGISAIVMDYIDGPTWILRDPSIDNLVFGWRDRTFYDSMKLPKTVDFFMFGFARWDCTHVDWRGLVGSTGA
ncbi:Mu-like prophage major head subunit gpT family protein [Paenibacillus cucumis (ex Kampfer et al. 2016)]|uniref:Mu-like prophage major head subunit gpT family protein n=1 Tax=Paenibacillus cucumis (ex Kampfer et al. 2016) TaxID=1776858 RepID=A0ABS7KM43_9BACL|nr:Mu-like prophage major head subunit gpT family protein [Paenibacillus cucumis (ex Kampfer et al. 2016)]MBY0205255.1 Mu-like prophage major head subunit gpT family protein [Paenibacillus cucumis (ex Kampfer et al. 2016)]